MLLVMGVNGIALKVFTTGRTGEEPRLESPNTLESDDIEVRRVRHPHLRQYTWVKVADGNMWG